MMITEDDKPRLKHLRTIWGWLFLVLWIVLWWRQLDGIKQAALVAPCPESFLNGVSEIFVGKGQACRAAADRDFLNGMIMVVVTSPIGFLFAAYFARWRLERIKQSEMRAAMRNEQARQAKHEATVAELSQRTQMQQLGSRVASDRFEIITRLGAVDDQLIVLDGETNPETIKLIHLNIGQSLRDIHAKFTDEELQQLMTRDEGLRTRVTRTLAEMERLGLTNSRLMADLAQMFRGNLPTE